MQRFEDFLTLTYVQSIVMYKRPGPFEMMKENYVFSWI